MVESNSGGQSNRQSDDRTAGGLTRRSALTLLGMAGIAPRGTHAASAPPGNGNGNGNEGGGGGNQPWYDWEADVDANGYGLSNLGALEVDRLFTGAREADVVVWKDRAGTFYADGHDGPVASGEDAIAVIQAAVDSLTEGRTSKEKVLVASPVTVGQDDDFPIRLPSYTIFDAPAGIHVEGEPDQESAVVVQATDAESVEIPSLTVTGYPNFSVWIQSCSNVRLGDISIRHATDSLSNTVVRIDDFGDTGRTTDVQVDQVYVEEGGHHAFETYGVDRIQVDQMIGVNPDGCVVLLNDTTDATVNSVVGREPGVPAGYATFRVANGTHDVTVGEVVSRGGARGVFGVSECYDVTVGEVNIVGAENGMLIQNCQNFTVESGVVKNSDGDAVRVDTRDDGEQFPAEGVSISNLRIVDDRDEPQQTYGIRETGPATNHNRFVNNDVRGAGTEANVSVFADTTVVRDNVGGGVASGTVTLQPGASPAARVEGVGDRLHVVPEVRAAPATAPETSFGWESQFVWDGAAERWNLRFEWTVDPGERLQLGYTVDQNQTHAAEDPPALGEGGSDTGSELSGALVDSFEDGDLSEYIGATGAYVVDGEPPVADGSYSLKKTASGTAVVASLDGLPRYPEAGDTFFARAARTDVEGNLGFTFGMQDTENYYLARVYDTNRLQLYEIGGSGGGQLAESVVTTEANTLYTFVVDWGTDGTIQVDLRDGEGATIGSVSATSTTFTDGGVGARRTGVLDDVRIV